MALQFVCSQLCTIADVRATPEGCSFTGVLDAAISDAIDEASDMLGILTGLRVHGVCTSTVYPVGSGGCGPRNDGYYGGDLSGWGWSVGSPRNNEADRFGGIQTIPLRGPDTSIVEIKIAGVTLLSTEYKLLDGIYLARVNGGWPSSNSLDASGWTITYSYGRAPDYLTRQAAAELAVQLAMFWNGFPNQLPNGLTGANVQGASYSLQDRAEALRAGDEQLPAVARFLGIYAPASASEDGRNRASVWSPELEQGWNLVTVT